MLLRILKSGSQSLSVNKIRTLKSYGSDLNSFVVNGIASENGKNEIIFELKLDDF